MKSTGLFGKNSGRVGGVVYSNYRGEQVVRTYQPKVNNPSTKKQVEQRAKFKLVSQVSATFGKELKLSFIPNVQKESNRNAFVKAMLKKTTYERNQASLPIEEIVLTNSRVPAVTDINASGGQVSGTLVGDWSENARVRLVLIGYNDGGEIEIALAKTITPGRSVGGDLNFGSVVGGDVTSNFTNVRALVYVFEPMLDNGSTYQDYETLGEEATLSDIVRVFQRNILYSETYNVSVQGGV